MQRTHELGAPRSGHGGTVPGSERQLAVAGAGAEGLAPQKAVRKQGEAGSLPGPSSFCPQHSTASGRTGP